MPQPILRLEWTAGVEGVGIDLKAAVEIIRVYILRPSISPLLFKSSSDKIQPRFIEIVTKLVRAGHPHHDWGSVCDQAHTLFTVAKSLFGLFAFDEFCCKPCEYI